MGKIETSIMENYKKALSTGNITQAKKSVELAKVLRNMIETESFIDYDSVSNQPPTLSGNMFKPYSYKYFKEHGVVIILKTTISLTNAENRLFYLLTLNETYNDTINIVKREEIKSFVWPDKKVTDNAVRIMIKRLRQKIEPVPVSPQIILNYNKKGYVFVAKLES